MVIKPKQQMIVEMIKKVLSFNGVSLNLKFKTLNPLQGDEPQPVQEVKMSAQDELDVAKYGEDVDLDEWVLVDSREVDYDLEDELDAELEKLNEPTNLTKFLNLVKTGTARPNASSIQDGKLFKHRYRYVGDTSDDSRLFCKKMIQANKVYRKEDIVRMSNEIVNETRTRSDGTVGGLGPRGATTYDVFFYKGGGACHHKWVRETYLRKSDVNSPIAQKYMKEFRPSIARKLGEIVPVNDKKVYTRPIDMPNKGFLPK